MNLTAQDVEYIIRQGVPLAETIDLRVEHVSAEGARIRIPFRPAGTRPGGSLSGPVIMAAADAAMYAAILGVLGRVEMAVTSNLNINFLQRPARRDLLASARLLKLGRRLAFLEVELVTEDDETLVAHATGSYALPSEAGGT
ncbi:PaaI family thioesterase [Hahella sp. SMD15-11]|uniref:PaaI family thioesterase n=1 Tax=Thermohahella caldifontis TaxID=3142973 RepID=A0AB39UXK4_9GAMM